MKKILIADDYPDMRELLARQIERLGFIPILAENGQEVLEKAIVEQPRLILMDMMMPVMDGWGRCEVFAPTLRPRISRSSQQRRCSMSRISRAV